MAPDREIDETVEQRLARIERKLDRLYYWAFGYEPDDRSLARTIRDMETWVSDNDDLIRDLTRDLSERREGTQEMSKARLTLWVAVIAALIGVTGGLVGDLMRAIVFLFGGG